MVAALIVIFTGRKRRNSMQGQFAITVGWSVPVLDELSRNQLGDSRNLWLLVDELSTPGARLDVCPALITTAVNPLFNFHGHANVESVPAVLGSGQSAPIQKHD